MEYVIVAIHGQNLLRFSFPSILQPDQFQASNLAKMKSFYTLSLLALAGIAAAEEPRNSTSNGDVNSCILPDLDGTKFKASCFMGDSPRTLITSKLDLNHCFGASIKTHQLTDKPDGNFQRKCARCKLGGAQEGSGTEAGNWSLYCYCVGPKTGIPLHPTITVNERGLLQCHGHVAKLVQ
ncbi:hypothetical protein BDV28DRAFT_144592 [Aspergillus coremiiformis]|uniref:Cyanovirin-N domain-containing protein n=1 Tax=Aspergillus coremiiformis TaxID=138285 RepID=A0A5N6ZL70_9EURO|nr:hypothetical protein BDV28DRAFT_144592 [Aspergillus coremiiformis]